MLSFSVVMISTGQTGVLKKTLKYLRKRIDLTGIEVHWLIGDDYVNHPKIDNQGCRAFIQESSLFEYSYFPDSNQGLGRMFNHLYEKVATSYTLHLEHDWKFLKPIRLEPLLEIMEEHEEISCIRFNKKITKALPVVFWLGERERERTINGVTLTQTRAWTFNPTIYRTAHVKKALPIDSDGSEGSFKAKMHSLRYQCYSLGRPGETYVKHLRGISDGRY